MEGEARQPPAPRGQEDMPLALLLAIMPGTRLRVKPDGGDWKIVTLNPGDLLVFRGDLCHHGMGYEALNYRVHAYVYAPDYNPPPSALNGCAHGDDSADEMSLDDGGAPFD